MVIYIKNKLLNNPFFLLSVFFFISFLLPLFLVSIPLQREDICSYIGFNSGALRFLGYETMRLPVQGVINFLSYKLLYSFNPHYTQNIILALLYTVHLFSAFFMYVCVKRILSIIRIDDRNNSISFWSALLFLVSTIPLDAYVDLAAVTRNPGILFAFAYVFIKTRQVETNRYRVSSSFMAIIFFTLGLFSYESYIVYIFVGFLFVFLSSRKIQYLFSTGLEFLFVFIIGVIKAHFLLNNITSMCGREGGSAGFYMVKEFALYMIQTLAPNLHGSLLIGDAILLLVWGVVLIVFVKNLFKKRRAPEHVVSLYVLLLFIITCIVLSFSPAYIPRALYAGNPILCLFLAYFIVTSFFRIRYILLTGIVVASLLNLGQFYYLQGKAYQVLLNIENKYISIVSDPKQNNKSISIINMPISGVRLSGIDQSQLNDLNDLFRLYHHKSKKEWRDVSIYVAYNAPKVDSSNSFSLFIKSRIESMLSFRKKIEVRVVENEY